MDLELRVDPVTLQRFYAAQRQLGRTMLAACLLVGIAAPLVSVYLSIASLVSGVGALYAVLMLRRAARELRASSGLVVRVAGKRLSASRDDGTVIVGDRPIVGGQAFDDHVQLTVGEGLQFQDVLVPLATEDRARLLAHASAPAVHVPINVRGSQGWMFFITLTVVPTLLVGGLLAYRLIVLLVLAGLVEGLHQLPPTLAIACVLVLAASGVVALAMRRRVRR